MLHRIVANALHILQLPSILASLSCLTTMCCGLSLHIMIHYRYPYFLWNCLPRAGASQFHGHAQVMLSKVRQMSPSSPFMHNLNGSG